MAATAPTISTRPSWLTPAECAAVVAELARVSGQVAALTTRVDTLHTALTQPPQRPASQPARGVA